MVLPSAVGKLERKCARLSESIVMATKTKREENRNWVRKDGKEGADRTVKQEI